MALGKLNRIRLLRDGDEYAGRVDCYKYHQGGADRKESRKFDQHELVAHLKISCELFS